ncbi:MAG: hypothetical protein GX921_06860 [Bacteroidales bacterium]|nr:hypothetical protein [Bacteroidales bacterium]
MTIEDLKNTKIYLKTEDEVKQFQEKVFKLGVEWQEGGNSVDSSYNFYHISQQLKLSCYYTTTSLHFIDIRRKQIFIEDVLSIKESVPVGAPVLVRDEDNQIWKHNIFGGLNKDPNLSSKYLYICTGSVYTQCVPYEGNEHLLGTSNPA